MKPFGKLVRQLRLAKELTLTTLAEKLGITAGYLSQVERSDTMVFTDLRQLKKLAKAVNHPFTDIVKLAFQSAGRATLPMSKKACTANDAAVALAIHWNELSEVQLNAIACIAATPAVQHGATSIYNSNTNHMMVIANHMEDITEPAPPDTTIADAPIFDTTPVESVSASCDNTGAANAEAVTYEMPVSPSL